MQKCGQLHASIAVALIAQSAGAVCPIEMLSKATTVSNASLRISGTSLSRQDYLPKKGSRTSAKQSVSRSGGSLLPEQRLVIVRRFIEQRSIREIALELGRSE